MNLKFKNEEKLEIIFIIVSSISLVLGFLLSIDYLSWISIIICGIPIFKECIEGLITEFDIKADLLVSIAIIASIIIGEIFAAGEIATIMAIGGFLEEYTVAKAQNQIKELAKMTPKTATRIKNGTEEKVPIEEVKIGDILKILPGESIPNDGIIINGETSINQATLTGESIPVDKTRNDEVYSGTINLYGSFTMKTTKISEDSSLQKLIKLVESSKPENANIVRAADKWATMIVVIAFTAAILTYLFTFEITRSVTILVVFCPCALVLATPTALMAAVSNLTKYGILVKNGESLEELAHIDEVIFDKTGTLTYGNPTVIRVISENPQEMMYLAASLESKSEHPLAKAIVKYYNNNDLAAVNEFKIHIGKGITGYINGVQIIAGNKKFLESKNIPLGSNENSSNGEIEIFVAKGNKIIGKIFLADTIRSNAKATIKNLKKLRIKTTLLTGDNENTAKSIANQVRIHNIKFNCLPEDKIQYIKDEQIRNHRVAMIGDGINDAPSLRKSNVGISMGNIGSDLSIESSNITLIKDNIENIPHLIEVSKKTIKTINISIGFALTLNIIAMALAILGILNPIEGALIHNIGSVIVIIYSSILVNYKSSKIDYRTQQFDVNKALNITMF
ncbi:MULTISPECIES: cation-translocating P-type ATPase [Methanobrevibacter]|uniref:Copper/silver-translocating P-type ATPase n=1 Tax=Methanobrevibacter gottschalkii DSM 11977 TaxID=1122229 RepID=A0A3N5B4I6_9EURY|nr:MULTISPECIES: cation-translocating P-type ATPase [Methanobrevibacter]OEC95037.1 copper-translocating P-type ATPase [Methanobrevibacter sp. A27]RPF52566.1 copper/silver-translocating P-type ATPase [Methanobrevibacter gottschalkii DSM 11977]